MTPCQLIYTYGCFGGDLQPPFSGCKESRKCRLPRPSRWRLQGHQNIIDKLPVRVMADSENLNLYHQHC